jgi:hypothetical protein
MLKKHLHITVFACLVITNALYLPAYAQVAALPPATTQPPVSIKHPTYGINDTLIVAATIMPDGTLIPTGTLLDAYCYAKMPQWMAERYKEWTRLRNAVYVCYPYAKAAGKIINEVNASLTGITDSKERKRLIKLREKDIRKNFTEKITDLSVYQGKVLMKLINRETGNNCYEILKEYKGGFNAVLYQSIAFFFGSNLKQGYDPTGEDLEIEKIVKDVEKMYVG